MRCLTELTGRLTAIPPTRRVGLSKSNVIRYFPTREAIFLTLLLEDYAAALNSLEALLAASDTSEVGGGADGDVEGPARHLAERIAETFSARPRLCELLSTSPAVLERNVPAAEAETFKRGMLGQLHRLAGLIAGQLPLLTPIAAFEAAGISWLVIAGTWPMTRPTPAVSTALDNPELAILRIDFTTFVSRALHATLTGLQHLPPPPVQANNDPARST